MRKLVIVLIVMMCAGMMSVSCRYQRVESLGDTVAASIFEPEDTMAKRLAMESELAADSDSVGVDTMAVRLSDLTAE